MIKKFLLGLGLLILILILAICIGLIQPHLLRGLISSSAQRFAGLEVEIYDIQSHLKPLRFEISGLRINNPEWPRPELLALADITIALTQSPFSHLAFWELSAKKLDINLEQNEAGELNWISNKLKPEVDTAIPEEISNGPILPGDFNFNRIAIKDITLNWRNKKGHESQVYLPEITAERIEAGNGNFYIGLDYLEQHIELNSAITLFDPLQGILGYDLSLHHQNIDIKSKGKLFLNANLSGSTLSINIDLRSASALNTLVNTEVPVLPKIKFSSNIAITPNYELSDIVLQLNDNIIEGNVNINAETSAVDASLRSAILDIDRLLPPLPAQVEGNSIAAKNTSPANSSSPNLAVQSNASVKEAEIDWAWLDETDVKLKISIEKLKAVGWQLTKLNSNITLKQSIDVNVSASKISELAGKRDINDFSADIRLQPLSNKTSGADVNLSLKTQQQGIAATVTGKLNLNGVPGTELQVTADAQASKAVWTLAQLPWREAGKLSIAASVKTSDDSYAIKGSGRLGTQSSDLNLSFTPALKPEEIPVLSGNIALRKIDLAFLSPPVSAKNNTEAKLPAKSSKTKMISNDPLALDALNSINAKLQIEFEDIDTGYNFIKSAKLKPTLQNGLLRLKDTTVNFDGGEAKVALILDASKTIPEFDIRFSVDAENYGKLGLNKAADIDKGKGRIRLDADSKGLSLHQLAANMNGKLDIKITDLLAQGNALNLIGSDVLSETIDKLNPFSEAKTSTEIECVAVHFKGNKGKFISDDGIALETKQTKIIGTGNIDIGKEKFLLGLSPIARTGVGINVGAAASLVRLGGTFSKPKIVADPAGMFTSGLSTGAAIYTGGLSLLAQGLIKRAIYSGSACDGDIDDIPTVEELPDEILNPLAPEATLPQDDQGTATPIPAAALNRPLA
ncbi:hypothetical protein [Zhongshania sp.]|uniref:AsmA family protein n=1 Tax=Zhongshania sp. TaxID=1971902 RepID=UPI0039E397A2